MENELDEVIVKLIQSLEDEIGSRKAKYKNFQSYQIQIVVTNNNDDFLKDKELIKNGTKGKNKKD